MSKVSPYVVGIIVAGTVTFVAIIILLLVSFRRHYVTSEQANAKLPKLYIHNSSGERKTGIRGTNNHRTSIPESSGRNNQNTASDSRCRSREAGYLTWMRDNTMPIKSFAKTIVTVELGDFDIDNVRGDLEAATGRFMIKEGKYIFEYPNGSVIELSQEDFKTPLLEADNKFEGDTVAVNKREVSGGSQPDPYST